jgi:hypothetical protein
MQQRLGIILFAIVMFWSSSLHADSFFAQFKDNDGWMDVSDWILGNAIGFMPVPIIITEPAVDSGIGLAALFFHPPDDYSVQKGNSAESADAGAVVLPGITGVAAAITGNDSWFVGGGHFAHWKDDTIRYQGVAGYASVNLTFYGFPGGTRIDDGIQFKSEGFFTPHPLSFRWKDSNVFFGTSWDYYNINTNIDLGLGIPEIVPLEFDVQLSGIDVTLAYDSLDNLFTPNSGIEAEISYGRKDDAIGSDFEYNTFEASVHSFWTLGSKYVLGFRLDGKNFNGDIPFFVLPFIDLRGIPAMRYQGETVVVAETELRWSLHPRIGVIGFPGPG